MTSTDHSPLRLVTGASSGIGLALVRHWLGQGDRVIATSRHATESNALHRLQAGGAALHCLDADLTRADHLDALATTLEEKQWFPDRVCHCAGTLHDKERRLKPEKRLEDVSLEGLQTSFAVNTFAPILLARCLLPLMPRDRPTQFASLSARVGSITDNGLGGWYSYRASKAAQNQLLRTLAIETRRRFPQLCVLLLHPGTTDTPLSEPFQRNVPPEKLFSSDRAARQLAGVMDNATAEDHGRFIAWDGKDIPW